MTTLFVLHGHTMNGTTMRDHLGELVPRLETHAELVFPNAPHECSEATVARLYEAWPVPRLPPPHFSWWNATDDGREYRGWEATRLRLTELMSGAGRIGIVGFSQGAIVAAASAALAQRGDLPRIDFAILVAGRKPRADIFEPYFKEPISVPTLHVWGEADPFARAEGPKLVPYFLESSRRVEVWSGSHRVPTRGKAAEAIVDFVRECGHEAGEES